MCCKNTVKLTTCRCNINKKSIKNLLIYMQKYKVCIVSPYFLVVDCNTKNSLYLDFYILYLSNDCELLQKSYNLKSN